MFTPRAAPLPGARPPSESDRRRSRSSATTRTRKIFSREQVGWLPPPPHVTTPLSRPGVAPRSEEKKKNDLLPVYGQFTVMPRSLRVVLPAAVAISMQAVPAATQTKLTTPALWYAFGRPASLVEQLDVSLTMLNPDVRAAVEQRLAFAHRYRPTLAVSPKLAVTKFPSRRSGVTSSGASSG